MAAGRSSEPRSVTVTTTNNSSAVTGPGGTFAKSDVGRSITAAAGIPAGTTITAVGSATAATLSANATATGSRAAMIGSVTSVIADALRLGYIGWSPETEDEAASYSVAANNAGVIPPDRMTNPNTRVSQRKRD